MIGQGLTRKMIDDIRSALAGWQLIRTGTFTASINITGLNGNADKLWQLVITTRHTATFTMSLRFNNDLGNNYNWNRHRVGRWGGTDVHDFATQGPSWPTEIQLGSTILSGQDVNIMIYPLTNKARSIIGQNLVASLGACSTTTIGGLWVNDVVIS